ncbi:two-component sensor histidine kinase BarA [Algibacillus agarilyticus]|uniref:two-component sensor histidine kinase BarA n=1 Tax=Algibacillus agarilyticus TaxID=2234133 RepID=UPI000DD00148|nr:two-component sensor histidine kinase BarA [Algibacillus agarilyticus]
MHNKSLKYWVLLLTVTPTFIISGLIAIYLTASALVELEKKSTTYGKNIVEPLAIASAVFIQNENKAGLKSLIDHAQRKFSPYVKSIAVFSADNRLLTTSNYHPDFAMLRVDPGQNSFEVTLIEKELDYLILRTPLINEATFDDDKRLNKIPYIALQLTSAESSNHKYKIYLTAFLILTLPIIISFGIGLFLVRLFNDPLITLLKSIEQIKHNNPIEHKEPLPLTEFDELRVGLVDLANLLSESQNELDNNIDQATSDLRQSIEQIEIQNVELDIAKRRALEANRVKSEFLANMSHELRTPLNGVLGFTRQLLKTGLTEHQTDYLKTIESSANNLLSIINDILDFSKLEAGRMTLEKVPYSIRDCIEEVMALLAPTASDKNLNFSIYIDDSTPDHLVGDELRVKQILTNLIGNALKFTEQGSVCVDLSLLNATGNNAEIIVSIKDTGIGISKEKTKNIFEPFGQADTSITRRYGGTGLGLVISQRLAKEMNGSISIESQVNQGSTFTLRFKNEINTLPLTEPLPIQTLNQQSVLIYEPFPHTKETLFKLLTHWKIDVTIVNDLAELRQLNSDTHLFDICLFAYNSQFTSLSQYTEMLVLAQKLTKHLFLAAYYDDIKLLESLASQYCFTTVTYPLNVRKLAEQLAKSCDKKQAQLINEPENTHQQTNTSSVVADTNSHELLIVDDNPLNLKLLLILLTEQGYQVDTAENGQEALDKAKVKKYKGILMDIQMPIMDGITACQAILENSLNTTTPIAAVTAHASTSEKQRIMQQGFTAYVTKPIDEIELNTLIFKMIQQQTELQSTPVLIPHYDDILDWKLALERANNREDLAYELFDILLKELPEAITAIQSSLFNQDKTQLLISIHQLHGTASYTGTPKLQRLANDIESQLKRNAPIDSQVSTINELLRTIEKIQECAAELQH